MEWYEGEEDEHNVPSELLVTDDEREQIKKWNRTHDKTCTILKNCKEDESPYGAIGGGRTYSLTPTSIGTIITVRCACGEEFLVDSNL